MTDSPHRAARRTSTSTCWPTSRRACSTRRPPPSPSHLAGCPRAARLAALDEVPRRLAGAGRSGRCPTTSSAGWTALAAAATPAQHAASRRSLRCAPQRHGPARHAGAAGRRGLRPGARRRGAGRLGAGRRGGGTDAGAAGAAPPRAARPSGAGYPVTPAAGTGRRTPCGRPCPRLPPATSSPRGPRLAATAGHRRRGVRARGIRRPGPRAGRRAGCPARRRPGAGRAAPRPGRCAGDPAGGRPGQLRGQAGRRLVLPTADDPASSTCSWSSPSARPG